MFRVTIKNESLLISTNGRYGSWGGVFDTLEEANQWLLEQSQKPNRSPLESISEVADISKEVEIENKIVEGKKIASKLELAKYYALGSKSLDLIPLIEKISQIDFAEAQAVIESLQEGDDKDALIKIFQFSNIKGVK